jgi:hypothetical protein
MPTAGGEGCSVVSGGWGWAGEPAVRTLRCGAQGVAAAGWICACCTKGRINPAQSSAAAKQAKRSAPCHIWWTAVATPNFHSLATFAIKQASFSTQRSREQGTEHTERKDFGASRGVPSNTARSAMPPFSVASVPSSLLLCVEKLACLPWIGPPAVPTPSCRHDSVDTQTHGWPP